MLKLQEGLKKGLMDPDNLPSCTSSLEEDKISHIPIAAKCATRGYSANKNDGNTQVPACMTSICPC